MSLLDEIRADQAALDERVNTLVTSMKVQAISSIESTHTCHPMVGALVGVTNDYKLYQLHWDNAYEMEKVFGEVNESLADANASASISLFNSTYTPRERVEGGPDILSPSKPAILIVTRTQSWRRATLLPYTITEEGDIEWDDAIEEVDFSGGPITVPESN